MSSLLHTWRCAALLCCALGASAAAKASDVEHRRSIRVVGSSIEIDDIHGRTLVGADLVGAELQLSAKPTVTLRIAAVYIGEPHGVVLHEIEAVDSSGKGVNVCAVDRDQRRLAVFIEGFDLPDGTQTRVPGRLSIACSAGVRVKCLRAGYVPWDDSHGPGSGQALFQTCTRLFRADYCGDGRGWTQNGMAIDLFDRYGIQQPASPGTLPFEAAWGPGGAVCVHHTRVTDNGDLAAVVAYCPRLARPLVGPSCTEEAAASLPGALLSNRSADNAAARP